MSQEGWERDKGNHQMGRRELATIHECKKFTIDKPNGLDFGAATPPPDRRFFRDNLHSVLYTRLSGHFFVFIQKKT